MTEKMDRHLFGFEFRGDSWVPLPYPGVYCYREGLAAESAPIPVSYHGQIIDQQQNEFFFDEPMLQLIVVWRYHLASLDQSEQ